MNPFIQKLSKVDSLEQSNTESKVAAKRRRHLASKNGTSGLATAKLGALAVFVRHLLLAGDVRVVLLVLTLAAVAAEEVIFQQSLLAGMSAPISVALVQVADEHLLARADVPGRVHHLGSKEHLKCRGQTFCGSAFSQVL